MRRPELLAHQWQTLLRGLERVQSTNPFYREKFAAAGVPLADLKSPADLWRIPFTTKDELLQDQLEHGPYGSNLTAPLARYTRIHQTSGSSGRRLRWLDTAENWDWILSLWAEIYEAVEISSSDRFFFPFSFGPFLGFWAAFEAAIGLGHFTMAGGGMSTVARLEAILDNRATVVGCTPTHALHLAEVALREGIDLKSSTVRMLILAGEPGASIPSVRERIESSWGARAIDHSGMTEIASLGIEYASLPGKLFLLEGHCIAEFLKPGTDQPVGEGELGEFVVTPLGRWDSPLIRYRTGDICRWRADAHPPGKPYVYLDGGLIGRTDDMVWIKGNNVYPSTLEGVLLSDPLVAEFRIEVDDGVSPPGVTVVVEPISVSVPAGELTARLSQSFQNRLYFRPELRFVEAGSLERFEMKSRRVIRLNPKDRLL